MAEAEVSPLPIRCKRCEPLGVAEDATHFVGFRPFFLFTDWRGGVGQVWTEYLCRQHAETVVRLDPRVGNAPFLEIRLISWERLTS